MEFWGIEVKGKESTKVTVEDFHILHLSQAVLSDTKKDSEPVTLYVKVDDKKLVLGVLSVETNPQLSFDLVFEKDFELSHNAKNACVHLLGYMSEIPLDDGDFSGPSDEDEEDVPDPQAFATVKAAIAKARAEKAANPIKNAQAKPEAKVEEDDDDDDSDEDEDSGDESDDEDMVSMGKETNDSDDDEDDDDDDDDDDEESSEEEETPVKVESGKKRKAEAKTPEPKKAKLATPQKTDGKKSERTATPHPSKKGGKTPSSSDKSTPKTGGQLSCGPCKKTFTSDSALQSHTKAKHSGGK